MRTQDPAPAPALPTATNDDASSIMSFSSLPDAEPHQHDDLHLDDDDEDSEIFSLDSATHIPSTTPSTTVAAAQDWAAAAAAAAAASATVTTSSSSSSFLATPTPSSTSTTDQAFRKLEAKLIVKYMDIGHSTAAAAGTTTTKATAIKTKDKCWFILDAEWRRAWTRYVLDETTTTSSTAAAASSPPAPPGPLSNVNLFDSRSQRIKQGLVEGIDYVAVPPTVYFIFALLYGTSSSISSGSSSTEGVDTNEGLIARFHTNIYGAEVPPSALKVLIRQAKKQAHTDVDRLMNRQHKSLLARLGMTRSSNTGGSAAAAGGGTGTSTIGFLSEEALRAVAAGSTASLASSSCCSSSLYSAKPLQQQKPSSSRREDDNKTPPAGMARFFSLADLTRRRESQAEAEEVKEPGAGDDKGKDDDYLEEKEEEGRKGDKSWSCMRHLYGCCFFLIPTSYYKYVREKIGAGVGEGQDGGNDSVADPHEDIKSIISSSFSLKFEEEDDEADDDMVLLWRNRRRTQQQEQQQQGGGVGKMGMGMLTMV